MAFQEEDFDNWILINPSNASLTGCRNFPYFPRGGPVPLEPVQSMHKDWQPLGYVSQWGGMEVGTGMLYPVSVVDGLVHQMGGWKLQAELQWKRLQSGDEPCPTGTATTTSAGNEPLNLYYDRIVHTTPPFYKYDKDPVTLLTRCYASAIWLAFDACVGTTRAAVPLLGSGARGFPLDVACQVAVESVVQWLLQKQEQQHDIQHSSDDTSDRPTKHVIAFGLLDEPLAEQLASGIHQRMHGST
jgi:O-acetyl-ADP-ribose deacetylase (regulator of RNase III)